MIQPPNRTANRHVLVTGGAGFIGSHVVAGLLEDGAFVTVLDNFDPFYSSDVKRRNLAAFATNPQFRLVEGDIRDLPSMLQYLRDDRFDVIVHLAALAGVRPSIEAPARYADVNVTGTAAVLEFAHRQQIGQLIFGSSSSVYGDVAIPPFAETDAAILPISPYAATKRAGELLCYTAHHLTGLSVACLRFFTVYGPRQRPDLAIHKFVKQIINQNRIQLYGDGSTRRDYTHVTDIVRGVKAAVSYVQSTNAFELINLGGGSPITLSDLVTAIEDQVGVRALVEWVPGVSGDVHETFASTTKAKALLGFERRVKLEDGLADFVRWYRLENAGREAEQRLPVSGEPVKDA